MIRIFSGTDSFESYSVAKKQIEKLAADQNQEVKIINASEVTNPSEFIQYLEGVGMFSSGYSIFLKRISGNKKLLEYFTDNYPALKSYDIVVWEDSKLDGRLKLFQTLKKENQSFVFELPKERDLNLWVKKICQDKAIKLNESQINILVTNLGSDKWRIMNEIEKISLFTKARNISELNESDFGKIVGFEVSGDIWKLVDSFSNRNKKSCLAEYNKISAYEENGQYIIAMIERELSNLSLLHFIKKDGLNESEAGLHPFVLQKLKAKIKNFSLEDLNKYMKRLFDLDRSIKNGDISEKIGLSLYILSI